MGARCWTKMASLSPWWMKTAMQSAVSAPSISLSTKTQPTSTNGSKNLNLKRLLIDRMENRILVGTVAFLASMVLIGWVAINEPGRMAPFQQQQLARSIEHGAELYTNNCAECHGPNGLGSARAPGLNNPQLFGVNFFNTIDTEIATLETAKADIEGTQATLNGDTSTLTSEQI